MVKRMRSSTVPVDAAVYVTVVVQTAPATPPYPGAFTLGPPTVQLAGGFMKTLGFAPAAVCVWPRNSIWRVVPVPVTSVAPETVAAESVNARKNGVPTFGLGVAVVVQAAGALFGFDPSVVVQPEAGSVLREVTWVSCAERFHSEEEPLVHPS